MTGESPPPITNYYNFDLLITRAGDRYRAFVVDAPAGEASVTFGRPFGPDEPTWLGNYRYYLEHGELPPECRVRIRGEAA